MPLYVNGVWESLGNRQSNLPGPPKKQSVFVIVELVGHQITPVHSKVMLEGVNIAFYSPKWEITARSEIEIGLLDELIFDFRAQRTRYCAAIPGKCMH